MHYFSLIFQSNFKNPALNFRALGRKTQLVGENLRIFDDTSIEKLNFYLFWGKFVAKNRAFGNNIFLLHFFRFGGVELPNLHSYSIALNHTRKTKEGNT